METWGLAGVGGGKDREKEKDTEEKQRTEEASFAPNDSFFCGAGRVGVQRGHHLTLEKFGELWRRAKRREAVEIGGAGQAQWRQVEKAGSSPQARVHADTLWVGQGHRLGNYQRGKMGPPRAPEEEGTVVGQEGSASCEALGVLAGRLCLVPARGGRP